MKITYLMKVSMIYGIILMLFIFLTIFIPYLANDFTKIFLLKSMPVYLFLSILSTFFEINTKVLIFIFYSI